MSEPTVVRHETRYLRYIMAALFILLAILLVYLVFQYRALRRAQLINGYISWHALVARHHGAFGASDVGIVQSWMTFDYVNHLFALPSSTLKDALSVTDQRYPHLTLGAYAGDDVNPAKVIAEVQAAIKSYDAASSTSNPAVTTSTMPATSAI